MSSFFFSLWVMVALLLGSGLVYGQRHRDSLPVQTTVLVDYKVPKSGDLLPCVGSWSVGLADSSWGSKSGFFKALGARAYLRQYSSNGIITLSLRGGSPQQVGVLWEGIPVRSAMLGLFDFSSISSLEAETATLYKGSQTERMGNGSVSGVLSLHTPYQFSATKQQQTTLHASVGGPWGYDLGAWHRVRLAKWQLSVAAGYSYADNRYSARNRGSATRPWLDADFGDGNQMYLKASVHAKVSETAVVSVNYWLNRQDRRIMGPLNSGSLPATQVDFANRLAVSYRKAFDDNRWSNHLQLGLSVEDLFYDSKLLTQPSQNLTKSFYLSNLVLLPRWGKSWTPSVQLQTNLITANTNNYDKLTENGQHSAAVLGSLKYAQNRFLAELALRTEYASFNKSVILIPTLGFNWAVRDKWTVKASMKRNYRTPTLNDLFWSGGSAIGNPNLRCELGWHAEFGAAWKPTENLAFQASFYGQHTQNLITWQPNRQQQWSPVNIDKARQLGLEAEGVYKINLSKNVKLTQSMVLNWVDARDLSAETPLPLTPKFNANLSQDWSFSERWQVGLTYQYLSARYLDLGGVIALAPIHQLNGSLGRTIGDRWTLRLELNNLLGQTIEYMPNYPQPLLAARFKVGIRF